MNCTPLIRLPQTSTKWDFKLSRPVCSWFHGTQVFPSSVRDKKVLVLGCGNSELSEKMCLDGFRDVLSIDVSESAIAQMSERAPRFNSAETKCRWMWHVHPSFLDPGSSNTRRVDVISGQCATVVTIDPREGLTRCITPEARGLEHEFSFFEYLYAVSLVVLYSIF